MPECSQKNSYLVGRKLIEKQRFPERIGYKGSLKSIGILHLFFPGGYPTSYTLKRYCIGFCKMWTIHSGNDS